MTKITRVLALCSLLAPATAFALDTNDEQALRETMALLSNQQALANFTRGNPDATHALDQVHQLTGGNVQQNGELNAISSSIFADLVKQSNGDSAEIQNKLALALKDPGAFMKTLTPEQQNRIHSLATQIDASRAPASK